MPPVIRAIWLPGLALISRWPSHGASRDEHLRVWWAGRLCFSGWTNIEAASLLLLFSRSVCCVLSRFSRVWLFVAPWTVACQAPLSMGFSRQEYWSGLPFPPPGDHPDPGIEPASPVLAGVFLSILTSHPLYWNLAQMSTPLKSGSCVTRHQNITPRASPRVVAGSLR